MRPFIFIMDYTNMMNVYLPDNLKEFGLTAGQFADRLQVNAGLQVVGYERVKMLRRSQSDFKLESVVFFTVKQDGKHTPECIFTLFQQELLKLYQQ